LKKKSIIILIISIILIYPILGFSSDTAESDDPLITLSYLDYRLDEVNSEFSENISNQSLIVEDLESTIKEQAELISSLKDDINNLKVSSSTLEVVELSGKQKIILEAGSEIILRAGTAYAITSDQGGLSDVTSGVDIKQDESIPRNHQLIIPRSDGRGVYVDNYAIFMVTGVYEIIDY
jgi:hypothetical protein